MYVSFAVNICLCEIAVFRVCGASMLDCKTILSHTHTLQGYVPVFIQSTGIISVCNVTESQRQAGQVHNFSGLLIH